MRRFLFTLTSSLLFAVILSCCSQPSLEVESEFIVVAYISGGEGKPMPDFDHVTHLNYAFGHVSGSCDSLVIDNIARLDRIAASKIEYNKSHAGQTPRRMLLSIGGWGSGNFSEMAADSIKRGRFVDCCLRELYRYSLDGLDLDWEYPSSGVAGISYAPEDIDSFTMLVRELREAIGNDKLLTIATISTARFIDFEAVDEYIDFYNIMSYDMDVAPHHHSPLKRSNLSEDELMKICTPLYLQDNEVAQEYGQMYKSPYYLSLDADGTSLTYAEVSKIAGQCTAQEALLLHLSKGIPRNKLTLGIPFYGKVGGGRDYPYQNEFSKSGEPGDGYTLCWDNIACVPYIADENGELVYGFENSESISAKCDYIRESRVLGGMYWEYCIDTTFAALVASKLLLGK